jgi:hypothetical protein
MDLSVVARDILNQNGREREMIAAIAYTARSLLDCPEFATFLSSYVVRVRVSALATLRRSVGTDNASPKRR